MLKTLQWYQSLGLFSWYLMENCWKSSKICTLQHELASPRRDSTSPCVNSSYSSSRFFHSTRRSPRMQFFEFCCRKWTRNITLNCFDVLKPVLGGVMVMLIHLQWLISKFHVLYVLIWFLKFWYWCSCSFELLLDHRNYLLNCLMINSWSIMCFNGIHNLSLSYRLPKVTLLKSILKHIGYIKWKVTHFNKPLTHKLWSWKFLNSFKTCTQVWNL